MSECCMAMLRDFLSLLLFLKSDHLKNMIGKKVEMEVVVEMVVEVVGLDQFRLVIVYVNIYGLLLHYDQHLIKL